MKTSAGTLRTTACLLLALLISGGLAACGGGGSSSPGTSGPAVSVSIASATRFPDGTSAPSTDALSPATSAPPVNFQHLLVTVTKLALIPSTGEDKTVTDTFAPVTIDLLDLNSSTGDNVATLLNKFASVPAGEYSKIRVYYDNVVGQTGTDNVLFHPTANSHFDVNFRGKNLVIPVASSPGGGIEFYSVLINVVGLKHVEAGNSGNFLLRPQVFATVVEGSLEYKVTGYADNVASDGTFDILTLGGRSIPAAFTVDPSTGTEWAYSDNVLENSPWVIDRLASEAVPAFKNGAIVSAIGVFDSNLRLQASHITFSFPDVREGTADNVWIPPDNVAFVVHSGADNVVVFPAPDRFTAYYDNGTFPHPSLTQAAVVNGVQIKARGYNVTGGIEAFWITVGEITVGP